MGVRRNWRFPRLRLQNWLWFHSGFNALGKRMSIPVNCAACGSTFNVNEKYAGRRFACRNCRAPLEVPAATVDRSSSPVPRASTPRPVAESHGNKQRPASAPRPAPQPASDPNALHVTCPGCGNVTLGTVAFIGRRVRCKQCGHEFKVAGAGQSRSGSRAAASPDVDLGARPPLDDLLVGISIQADPTGPLAPAPVKKRKAPVERKVRESRYDDEDENRSSGVETTDQILGILGLIWAIAMIVVSGLVFYRAGAELGLATLFGAVVLANMVVFLIALFRIAWNGSPGTAILCFFGCGIGEIVALVLSNTHARKWKVEGILPTWTMLAVVAIGGGAIKGGYDGFNLKNDPWSSDRSRNSQAREREPERAPQPSGPPTPQIAPPNLDKEFARFERKVANRDALAKLLESVQDAESAKSVAAKHKELQDAYQAIETPSIPPTASADQQRRYSDFLRRDAEATARIAREEYRVRAIAGAAEPLGLVARSPDPSEGPPIHPERPRQRPEPTTPEEQIDYALEDLEGGDVFKRREAAKTLRSIEVDELRRDEVSKALQRGITDKDPFLKEEATAALVKWATRKNIASLIEMLDGAKHSHGDTRKHAIRALAQFKEDKCARAIAKMLFTDDWMVAVDALKEMGPVSEAAVLGQIDNEDPRMRFQICGILEEVGSSFSLDDLKRHASGDRVREVKQAAKDAVKAIESRSGKSEKSGKSR